MENDECKETKHRVESKVGSYMCEQCERIGGGQLAL